MKLQVIAEGSTAEQRKRGEWGLAFLVDGSVLFDTFGDTKILKNNLFKYGIKLKSVKNIIISHKHWDHVSGLDLALQKTQKPKVWLPGKNAMLSKICRLRGAGVKISKNGNTGESGFSLTGFMTGKLKGGTFIEQGMLVESSKGNVLIAGCAHPGIIKMVKRAEKKLLTPVYAVIGGLHLKDASAKKIQATAAALKKHGVKKIYAGHCTGDAACKVLKDVFKTDFKKLKQGATYKI